MMPRSLAEMYRHVIDVTAQCRVSPSGDVRVSAEFLNGLLETLAEGIRNQGGSVGAELDPRARQQAPMHVEHAELFQRITRLEQALPFVATGGMVAEVREIAERVSEGAQRDSADLHKRLAVIEKRLMPPAPEDSWALMLPNEVTAAIEQIQKEFAKFRADYGHDAANHRSLRVEILTLRDQVVSVDGRSRTIVSKVGELDRGFKHLQRQWDKLRARLRALLSLDRDGSGTEGTPGGTSVG
jgi:cell division septum initiation protein DivIVA